MFPALIASLIYHRLIGSHSIYISRVNLALKSRPKYPAAHLTSPLECFKSIFKHSTSMLRMLTSLPCYTSPAGYIFGNKNIFSHNISQKTWSLLGHLLLQLYCLDSHTSSLCLNIVFSLVSPFYAHQLLVPISSLSTMQSV